MGESFGIWKMGNDEEIIPYIDMANLAVVTMQVMLLT